MAACKTSELIKRRRYQLLVHSRLYYIDDQPIVSDHQWQAWADELTQLQTKHPELCQLDFYDKEFSDWNGDTGFHLPLYDPRVMATALYVQRLHEERSQ